MVVSQFRVDIPGTQGRKCIVPDEVLFVNGIPLALVECKKPGSPSPRRSASICATPTGADAEAPEGNPAALSHHAAAGRDLRRRAVLGSITSGPEHYAPWRDPYPLTRRRARRRLEKAEAAVTQQDILAGAVLHPTRLLDIVHNYVTFMRPTTAGRVKAVPRYQQYRAVSQGGRPPRARPDAGAGRREKDQRGGIIWHTQGSGKSLTMTFLVRKMRTVPGLRKTKIVVVTDRDPAPESAQRDDGADRREGRRREEDQQGAACCCPVTVPASSS